MSSAELEEIIDLGHSFILGKYYSIAVATIFFYDFFLTLADEIKYAWHGKKTWVFVVFIANRYLPIGYQFWYLYIMYTPTFHKQPLKLPSFTHAYYRCEKTAFFEVLVTMETTLLAQVVLTLRVYAITNKNRMITSCLGVVTIIQFVFGLYLTIYSSTTGAAKIPEIPLPAYVECVFLAQLWADIAHPSMSLFFDLLAFSVIVYIVVKSNVSRAPIPGLLRIIIQDATYYFLVIFTSHFVLVMFLAFAKDGIKLLPAPGNVVFLPVMITRLLLSLRKASTVREHGWDFGGATKFTDIGFSEPRSTTVSRGDDIRLDILARAHGGTQSWK